MGWDTNLICTERKLVMEVTLPYLTFWGRAQRYLSQDFWSRLLTSQGGKVLGTWYFVVR